MSQRIAIAATVDLLVLGGGLGAAACALAARRAGLSVLVAAPHAGLADEVAGQLRLRPEEAVGDELAAAVFPGGACPTPLHAKRACEGALIAAGVSILLNALPCGALRAADGRIAGAVLAHRGGRSAVAARLVVDAGRSAAAVRHAGHRLAAWQGGRIVVESRLVGVAAAACGGEDLGTVVLPGGSLVPHRRESAAAPPATLALAARRCELALPALDAGGLCALDAAAQLAAFHPEARAMSDWARWILPVGLAGGERVAAWAGAAAFPLEALAVEPGLWVLSAAAPVARSVAARLDDPAAASALGARLGAYLAAQPVAAAAPAEATMPGAALAGFLGGFRPVGPPLPTVPCRDDASPPIAACEVLVAGGGTGGAPAGIAAAREGARVIVLERLHRLGGVGTIGRIGHYWFGNRSGFTAELDRRVHTGYGEPRFPEQQGAWWVLEHKQDAWLRMLTEAGASCWFGAQAAAVAVDGGRFAGVLAATAHGAGVVSAAACVDATGSADVAAAAGAPCRTTAAEHIAVQGTGLPPLDPRSDYQNSDHDFCDDNDAIDATRMLLRARAKFAGAWDVGSHIDSRERRQIRGLVELAPLDICCDRTVPDAVVRASSNFDSHGFTVHPVFLVHPMDKKPLKAWIPWRALLPQGVDGIVVTGLGMSAHRDALPVVRMQPDVQNAGFSAGVACAMAVRRRVGTAALPVADLQRRLVELGHLPPEVIGMCDSFPLPEAEVAALVGGRLTELVGSAAAFAAGDAALPHLRTALAGGGEAGERAALILGLQGHAEAAPALRALLVDRAWDAGWRFTGMGQFGRSMSPVDVRVVALAHCGAAEDLALVAALAAALPDDAPLSHIRAVAWACSELVRRLPATAAAARACLAALLTRPGMSGHAVASLGQALAGADADPINTIERERALRELHLAVALHRCGGPEAAPVLAAYRDGLHGHYARHAAAVLAERPAAGLSAAG